MKIDIMTLFPEMIKAVMRESIIGRAQDKGLVEVKATNIRDYALDKHHKADDAPYGGAVFADQTHHAAARQSQIDAVQRKSFVFSGQSSDFECVLH